MQKFLPALAVVSFLGIAAPALADVGSGGSIQRALMTTQTLGVVGFNEIQYYDGKWEIEGRDPRGKTIHVDVDAMTGAVIKVNRDY
jgi:hypothetical protein